MNVAVEVGVAALAWTTRRDATAVPPPKPIEAAESEAPLPFVAWRPETTRRAFARIDSEF